MRIALIAHDQKKDDMVSFVKRHGEILARHSLMATGTTGKVVEEATGLPVTKMQSGPYGGDQQIGAEVAAGRVDAVIFLRDPSLPSPMNQTLPPSCGCVMCTCSFGHQHGDGRIVVIVSGK